MKKLYLIGNHKMNLSYAELDKYFDELVPAANDTNNVVGVCLPACYLDLAKYKLEGSTILFGAENCYHKDSGAYTGEISAKMLTDFNCDLVIVGHSERRTLFGETDQDVNLKVKKALEFGLMPIMCFGETLEERNQNIQKDVVKQQVLASLEGIEKEDLSKIIFAYEPVWAIGTGLTATSDQAEEIISYAKSLIMDKYGVKSDEIIMLYGGSLKPSNAYEILSKPSINGGLIGGACLKVEDFKLIFDTMVE